jgi:osmoprotectant transport system permease protein
VTAVATGQADARADGRERRLLRLSRYVGVPLAVTVACGAMYLYVQSRELDSIEGRLINGPNIRRFAVEQLTISLWATLFILLIAVPLGVALTRPWARRITPYAVAVANIGQGTPAVGLVFLVFVLRISRVPTRATIIAMVIYAVLPVLRGTMVGLQQVDRGVIKAARGMGMSKAAVLLKVELPLSVPILLTGAGTFGALIVGGFAQTRMLAVAVGSVGAASMAIMADWLGGIAEDFLRPRGL